MIVSGSPAPETELGKDLTGDLQQLLTKIKSFSYGWRHIVQDEEQLVRRYQQVYNALKALIDEIPNYLKDFEPITFINYCLTSINFDVARGIDTIKYCVLYLYRLVDDIENRLRNLPQENLNQAIEATKTTTTKKQKRKEEQADDNKSQRDFAKAMKDDSDSGLI